MKYFEQSVQGEQFRVKVNLLIISIALFSFVGGVVAFGDKQTAYDNSVKKYNVAKEEMITAEYELSKEKLDKSIKQEDWQESERLMKKIKSIESYTEVGLITE